MILFAISNGVIAQIEKLKRIDTKTGNYTVLKSDKTIKHGSYEKHTYSGSIIISGRYEYNKKVGIWDYYEGKRLIQKYDYTTNELLFFVDDDYKDVEFKVKDDAGFFMTKLERPPVFIGGKNEYFRYFINELHVPQEARDDGISGDVLVSFMLNSDGSTSDYHIVRGIGGGCDEEALRMFKLMSDNWLPGIKDGQPVSVELVESVKFTLQKHISDF